MKLDSFKCENYLNAITDFPRNLIRSRPTRLAPIREVQFRTPSLDPVGWCVLIFMCVRCVVEAGAASLSGMAPARRHFTAGWKKAATSAWNEARKQR